MKIIVNLIGKMNDTLEEIFYYAEKAHAIHADFKNLSDVYIKIAEMHVDIYKQLHEQAVKLIAEERQNRVPPPEMLAIWNYEHENLVKNFSKAKFMIEEYHKQY